MSAIAGLVRFGGAATHAEAGNMVRTMHHRAPDKYGEWNEGAAALAHGALWTTPEAVHEVQPLLRATEGGNVALVCDARVDNRGELIEALSITRDGVITDAEIILEAYLRWGSNCPDRIIGDFAFAVWDPRGEPSVFAARDPFGVRPLYYHAVPSLFAWGTEAKAILSLTQVPDALDDLTIAYHLVGNREDHARTIFKSIKMLPGAHALKATRGGIEVWRYYEPQPASDVGVWDDEAYADRFRELFVEAVRCRMRGAFRVGAQLSGGLDSSSIACVARDILQERSEGLLPTFSLTFDSVMASDERAYAQKVLYTGGFEPYWVPGDLGGPLGNLDEVYDVLDDGLVAGTQHLVWELLKSAQRAGVRVVLDGFDGDTVVDHGHRRFEELARDEEWAMFGREARSLAERFAKADHRQNFEHTFTSVQSIFAHYGRPVLDDLARTGPVWRYLRSLRGAVRYAGASQRKELRRIWRRLIAPAWLQAPKPEKSTIASRVGATFVSPKLSEQIGLVEKLNEFEDPFSTVMGMSIRERQRAVLGMGSLAGGIGLMTQVAAVLGLEVAHPFMDRRLVEFCLALPPDQSLKNGWTRYILRRAMAHTLPYDVAWRTGKADMGFGFERGLYELESDVLKGLIEDSGTLDPFLDRERLLEVHRLGSQATDVESTALAGIATLTHWLKKLDDDSKRIPL